MKCISCGNLSMKKYTDTSYLKLPVFHCEKCTFYVTGESEIAKHVESTYKDKHWGENNLWSAKDAIKNNYDDVKSQGKKRSWISQCKYCKPYMNNKKKVLDIGAGQGQVSFWFDNEGFSVTAIEPDAYNVKLINEKLKNVCCLVGNAEDFNLKESFDIIWMSHVLEHVINPIDFFKNVKKNLASDGIFFIEVPNCENYTILNSSIFKVPHTFHFSKQSLLNLVKKSGFRVIRCDYFTTATKLEGIMNKLTRSRLKKFQFYPRIPTNNVNGKFLRIILKI